MRPFPALLAYRAAISAPGDRRPGHLQHPGRLERVLSFEFNFNQKLVKGSDVTLWDGKVWQFGKWMGK